MNKLQRATKRIPGIAYGIIALVLFFQIANSNFLSFMNINNILKNASILTIVSMGATLVILSAKIDLSIGYVMSLSAVIAGMIIQSQEVTTVGIIIVGLLAGMAVGAIFGLFNGIMIGKFKFDYWLITFSSMAIAQGLALVVSNGRIISGYSKKFRAIADGEIFGISTVIIIAAVICAIMIFISTRTRFGYSVYAIGDSEECANKSGINVTKARIWIYLISGILAGLGGILLASKTNSASSALGMGYEFNAIAAVVVGGTPSEGGKGGLVGTVFGSLFIAIMKSGLQFVGLTAHWQTLMIGLFIMVIILADVLISKHNHIRETRRVYRNAK